MKPHNSPKRSTEVYRCNKILLQYVAKAVTYVSAFNYIKSINRKFKWTQVEQDSFDKIKRIVDPNNLWTYPDFNETFKIHTDASALQLGAVISHKGKTIAFYSRKLTDTQKRYTVTKGGLLRIVENLKEFRTVLPGQKLRIYTDHKNLTCGNFNINRVLIWRLILEDYGPDIEYIKGEKNIVADALSRITLNGN